MSTIKTVPNDDLLSYIIDVAEDSFAMKLMIALTIAFAVGYLIKLVFPTR